MARLISCLWSFRVSISHLYQFTAKTGTSKSKSGLASLGAGAFSDNQFRYRAELQISLTSLRGASGHEKWPDSASLPLQFVNAPEVFRRFSGCEHERCRS